MTEIKSLSDCEKHNFLKAAKQHYLAAAKQYYLAAEKQHYLSAAKHIFEKTPPSSNFLKKLRCFHPQERKTVRICRDLVAVAKALQIDVPYDKLLDEWKALQLETENLQNVKIDVYWGSLLSLKTSLGDLKFPLVSAVVKAALVLSHGNAEVERGFSASGRTLTDDKASMSERTLTSIMTVKSILKLYNNKPELVPVTKELLNFAHNAYRNYENYLLQQKQLKEREEEKKRNDEEKKNREDENKEKILKEKQTIKNCQEALKDKRVKEEKKRKTADSIFDEATKRLKKGVENNNFQEIQLAEAMLQCVATVRKEENEERKKADAIQKTLEKKKSSLIDNYFKKIDDK